ncbi:hypothetical protein, partial [uncultured Dokdonia sp.]|uniref:hypothetical protein n=1 Tax=uncultured Dokdonia sp. TaxID=575653 RepID=UPI002605577A
MAFTRNLTILLFLLVTTFAYGQEQYPLYAKDIVAQRAWVDSVYQQMTPKERIGQLFMVDIFSSDPQVKIDKIKKLIKEEHIGG